MRTAGAGATEDPGAGRSGATVVVVGDEVTGSGRDGLGGGEDMIEPKLAGTNQVNDAAE